MNVREAYYSLPQAIQKLQQQVKKEGFKHDASGAVAGGVTAFILILIILQIALVVFAFYCIIKCSHLLPAWATVLLCIGMFMPWIGGAVAIGVIIYYFTSCKGASY